MGLVELRNVGKSATYNFLSKMDNYTFRNIDPFVVTIYLPDQRFEHLSEVYKSKSKFLAQISITDIAALKDIKTINRELASMNSKVLDRIIRNIEPSKNKEELAVMNKVREMLYKGKHVRDGSWARAEIVILNKYLFFDPLRDIETLNGILVAKDLKALDKIIAVLESSKEKEEAKVPVNEADVDVIKAELGVIYKVMEMLIKGEPVRDGRWEPAEIAVLNKHLFLTSKPVKY